MASICRDVDTWVSTNIQTPVTNWITTTSTACAAAPCNWWCLCCNKLICWLVVALVAVVVLVTIVVTRMVTVVVCEVVNLVLSAAAVLVNLLLSIPGLGALIRIIVNALQEIAWRLAGLPDLLGSLLGIMPPKRLHLVIVILNENNVPLAHTTDPGLTAAIATATSIFKTQCNVDLRFLGFCTPQGLTTPEFALKPGCDVDGYGSDFGIAGAHYQFVANECAGTENGRRMLGFGGAILAYLVKDVNGAGTIGCCAYPANWVTIEAANPICLAHEIGHCCGLTHTSVPEPTNLMNAICGGALLSTFQRAWFRNSRNVTFF
jgi:hypothetical protein